MKIDIAIFATILMWFGCQTTTAPDSADSAAHQTASIEKKDSSAYSAEDIDFLIERGAVKSETAIKHITVINQAKKSAFEKKYGIPLMTDEEMQTNLKRTGLVLAPLSAWTGIIPPENLKDFRNNYEIITNLDPVYRTGYQLYNKSGKYIRNIDKSDIEPSELRRIDKWPGNAWGDVLTKQAREKYGFDKWDHEVAYIPGAEVKIIAPISEIDMDGLVLDQDTNYVNPLAKDPAIVVKINEGWVFLTSWK